MIAFQWNQSFVTGLGAVDGQHRRLVELINQLGDLLADDRLSEDNLEELLKELVNYAGYHFKEEEDLMERAAMDPRHVEAHKAAHAGFIEEVILLREGLGKDNPEAANPARGPGGLSRESARPKLRAKCESCPSSRRARDRDGCQLTT